MKKFGSVCLFLFGLMLAAMFTWISMDAAGKAQTVVFTKNRRVELKATITSYDERTDIDEGYERTYWDQFVSYTYEGESYSGVRYGSTYSKPQLGKVVNVAIDPENPGELLPDNMEFLLSVILAPVFLVGVTFCVFFLAQGVAEKLQAERPDKWAYGFTACKLVGESVLYYVNRGSWSFGLFSLVAAVLCWLIVKRHKSKKKDKEPLCEVQA